MHPSTGCRRRVQAAVGYRIAWHVARLFSNVRRGIGTSGSTHADIVICWHVNADLIAGGLSPLKPQLAAIAAARIVLGEIDRLAAQRVDFAFETTLSGLNYARRLRGWKRAGYRVEIVYLRLRSIQLALRRIAARVRQGGHDVPRRDVVRRFSRSWENFERIYKPLADSWAVYDNSGRTPQLLEKSP